MVSLSVSQIEQLLSNPNKIRNVLVVCDSPSNNSFIDHLISTAAITIQPEDEKSNEPKLEETIYTPLYYECKSESASYLTNLLYSPNCKHLPSEIIANMRLTDGALLVIDYIWGVSTMLESMLRLIASDHIKQIIVINNIYRALSKFEQDPELIYQNLAGIVDLVNILRSSYTQSLDQANLKLKPENGNVAFELGPRGSWMFTINKFSSIYSKKFNINAEKLNEKLWGNHYFDAKTEKWMTQQITEDGRTLSRGFVEFILKPIIKLIQILANGNEEQLEKALAKIQVTLSPEERKREGINIVETVLSKWINSSDNLFEMIITHLPSPKEAQTQRIKSLYEGPQDNDCAIGIKECNPKSPLMIYVSRLVPISDKGRFFAVGRIFSGTVSTGHSVRIMGPDYKPGKKDDLTIKTIQRVVFIVGQSVESFDHVPCGTIIGLVGVDPYIMKTATISDSEAAQIIKPLKYQMPQVVRVAVEPKVPEDLPKLIDGLKQLIKSDPLAFTPYQETGEHVITGVDNIHLGICLDNLQNKFARCETRASNSYVNYRETVTEASPICLAKSPNKHCRFYCTAKPLSTSLADSIERGEIGPMCDKIQQARTLCEEFGWEKFDAQRIWAFGPKNSGPNIFVDMTKGVQFLNEIRDSAESAFQWATKEGVLCEEPWRQVRIDLIDTTMMVDAIHRGGGQVIPPIRRVCYACELTASPRLLEPLFMREIITQSDNLGPLYNDVNYKRGYILEEENVKGTDLIRVRFYLPTAESFSFDSSFKLYSLEYIPCGGIFNHWETVSGDPLDTNSTAYNIIAQIRKIKGLKEGIPPLDNYMDRL